MKLVPPTIAILSVVTTLDIPTERILTAALQSNMQKCVIVGTDAFGELYFASTMADGGDALWYLELAKKRLMVDA